MTILLNGQTVYVAETTSTILHRFLQEHGMKLDRIAVERNGEIVPRALWQEIQLAEGDRLEIVHFVGGGSVDKRDKSCSHRSP